MPRVTQAGSQASCADSADPFFEVSVDPALGEAEAEGRLLVLMSAQLRDGEPLVPQFGPAARDVWMAARDVDAEQAGVAWRLDPSGTSFPADFCHAAAGHYHVRAILDRDRNFAYSPDASGGDLVSDTVAVDYDPARAEGIRLLLDTRVKARTLVLPEGTERVEFTSPLLSRFHARPVSLQALVTLPPGYDTGSTRYPAAYYFHGFGNALEDIAEFEAARFGKAMRDGTFPPMVWILPFHGGASGTSVFADSANNGPWGEAFTRELIPYLESHYRLRGDRNARLLSGHSSGGWAALWLQVRYPELFGGAWPLAPDPVDFHSFVGIDLYRSPPGNFYVDDGGRERMVVRIDGSPTMSLRDLVRQEIVMGGVGQTLTFEQVFSPRDSNGRPLPLFDRESGAIDARVAQHWTREFDIAAYLDRHWRTLRSSLDGRIHVTVGTLDTMYLNEPVALLEKTVNRLGGGMKFSYAEGRDHFTIFQGGLMSRVAAEMNDRANATPAQ